MKNGNNSIRIIWRDLIEFMDGLEELLDECEAQKGTICDFQMAQRTERVTTPQFQCHWVNSLNCLGSKPQDALLLCNWISFSLRMEDSSYLSSTNWFE